MNEEPQSERTEARLQMLDNMTSKFQTPGRVFHSVPRKQRRAWERFVRKRLMAPVREKYEKRPDPFKDVA